MEKDTEFIKLLKIFIRVAEASRGIPAGKDNRILDAEGLATKFIGHSISTIYLYRSTTMPDIGVSFFDPASIKVLGRAALESFLVFYYLFVDPKTEELKDFRYNSWVYSGLFERQKFPVQSPHGKKQLLEEKSTVASLESRIKCSPCFDKLTKKQQKKMIYYGVWRLHSWTDIALYVGLNKAHAKAYYRYLCGYAHSGNLSIIQLRQTRTAESQKTLCGATIGLLIIAIANMIKLYCSIFPRSNEKFLKNNKDIAIVDGWIKIGSTSIEDIRVDWENIDV
tara:strand:+ start:380 stop:1219 length:840 start_codon:yes stop_codon:yes gene_type:complete